MTKKIISLFADRKNLRIFPVGFLRGESGNNANLEKAAKPRYTYTYYNKGGWQADVFSFADHALF
ncbi:hypothetical protein [Faecalibacterium wellingii]|uniref:Uncharacterized protein n=1 Tax=Faecalibacterium wellingii TaxID=2929491 RepID=A0ABU3TZ44_9FIRM|nr:hypothetical protein [Faecalibacterium prausnitzii]